MEVTIPTAGFPEVCWYFAGIFLFNCLILKGIFIDFCVTRKLVSGRRYYVDRHQITALEGGAEDVQDG